MVEQRNAVGRIIGATSCSVVGGGPFSPLAPAESAQGFGERLRDAIAKFGPLCLGIDPHPNLLRSWDLEVSADGLRRFSEICVEAFHGFAAVKPQVAFFESFGSAGYRVLEETIAQLRTAGVLVIADAKRGDIGSTMDAYAQAWAGDSPLASDAVTASPYLGFGSLDPLLDLATSNGRGVFVLAATSNPEGASVQGARVGEKSVAQSIIDRAAEYNAKVSASAGPIGVVVGATLRHEPDVAALNGPVLVPGMGAQGGSDKTLKELNSASPGNVLPVVAREVLGEGPTVEALRAAGERALQSFSYLT